MLLINDSKIIRIVILTILLHSLFIFEISYLIIFSSNITVNNFMYFSQNHYKFVNL